jgi:hypothetical protein
MDLEKCNVMGLILQDDLGRILVLVGKRNLNLLSVCDDVIVGQNPAILGQNEARALALLRYYPVEEVERQRRRSHVDYRRQNTFVDRDIVLLGRSQSRLRVGHSQVERRRERVLDAIEQRNTTLGDVQHQIKASTYQKDDKEDTTSFHNELFQLSDIGPAGSESGFSEKPVR